MFLYQAQPNKRQVAVMIKEFAEALVEYKKANTALLALTRDRDVKEILKTKYYRMVILANDLLDRLYK